MGVPNIQQQMYLKKALNENMDGMFDHPVQLNEAKRQTEAERNEQTRKQGVASRRSAWLRAKRASHNYVRKPGDKKGTWVPKTEAELKKERDYADAMMKGYGGSLDESYTMRMQYGRSAKVTPEQRAAAKAKGDAHVAKMSKTHTWVKGSGKNGGRWVPKQETNEETITEGLLNKIELAEGSIRASKIGKGKKFSPKMYDKYATKTAVRQLIKTGRDPNSIKFPLTRGLENYGFNVNAEDKRKAALKAKGLLREPKPLDPYTRAEARRIGDKVRNRQGKR